MSSWNCHLENFVSIAGEITDLNVNFEAGNIQLMPSAENGSIYNDIYWYVHPIKDTGEVDPQRRDAGVGRGEYWFVLNEGRYQVRGTLRDHHPVSVNVDVQQGETAAIPVIFVKQ